MNQGEGNEAPVPAELPERRWWGRVPLRALLPLAGTAAALLVAILVLGREAGHHLAAIEAWVVGLGPWGALVFAGLLVVGTSLLLPESIFGVAAGALFGLRWGAAVAVTANLLAGAVQYALAHQLLRARVQRALAKRPLLAGIERAVQRDQIHLQVLLRLTPLNPATISYLLGAAGVRFPGFLLACLAMTPHLLMEVYLGHAGKQVARLAAHGGQAARLHDLVVFGGLALSIFVVVMVSRTAHRAILQAVAESGAAAPGRGTA